MGWARQYWYGSPPLPSRGVSTSRTEIIHLLISLLVLTVDIVLVFGIYNRLFAGAFPGLDSLETLIVFGLLAGATGFLVHELAHKISAQRLGCWAEFRMAPVGLLFSLVFAYFGLLLAAPGATVIGGMRDRDAWGRTSLAGPGVNLAEGAVFFALALLAVTAHAAALGSLLALLAYINVYFAAFNLVPLGPLDGRKVWTWSHWIWAVSFVGSALAAAGLFLAQVYGWGPFG